tara:strand:+ start:314 stop:535 length:222 start_codon:yes stop_codon:yes gene_type:complete
MKNIYNPKISDLVYWYDPWKNLVGIGLIFAIENHWIKLIENSNLELILVPGYNIDKVDNYNSIEEFKKNQLIR